MIRCFLEIRWIQRCYKGYHVQFLLTVFEWYWFSCMIFLEDVVCSAVELCWFRPFVFSTPSYYNPYILFFCQYRRQKTVVQNLLILTLIWLCMCKIFLRQHDVSQKNLRKMLINPDTVRGNRRRCSRKHISVRCMRQHSVTLCIQAAIHQTCLPPHRELMELTTMAAFCFSSCFSLRGGKKQDATSIKWH